LQGMALTVAMGAFGLWYFSHDIFGLSFLHKVIIIGGWTFLIVAMSFGGNQIWPVPKASIGSFQLTQGTELYTSSVIPGILEDLNYLAGLPMVLALAYFLMRENVFGGEIGSTEFIITGIIACLIASTGYNVWVVPGFTSAHVPAYGGATMAYAGAWIFSFGQALVYFVTGIFLPLPHILHNLIIAYGQIYAVVMA